MIYAKQRGISSPSVVVILSEQTTSTVDSLRTLGKKMGLPITTKMRKAEIVRAINAHQEAHAVAAVDTSKLTPRQQRRLRKRSAQ